MKSIEIYLYGEITSVEDPEYGYIGARYVANIIAKNQDAEEIIVRINSPGGEVSEGFAIYDILRSSGKKITTIGEGRVASIATVVFLAGDIRKMTENTKFLIHNPWGGIEGDTDEIADYAKKLNETEKLIIDFYHEKTGLDKVELDKLMKVETEYSAKDAKKFGFSTETINTIHAKAILKLNSKMKNKKQKSLVSRLSNAFKALSGEEEEEAKNLTLELEDGTTVEVVTEAEAPAVGDAVTVDGEPAADGEHMLNDGRKIVVKDGKIAEILEAETNEEDDDEEMTALAKTISSEINKAVKPLLDSVAAIQAKQNEQEQLNTTLVDSVELIGQNLSSDGFKHSARKKGGSQQSKVKDPTPEEMKAQAIKNRRKKEGLDKEEE